MNIVISAFKIIFTKAILWYHRALSLESDTLFVLDVILPKKTTSLFEQSCLGVL